MAMLAADNALAVLEGERPPAPIGSWQWTRLVLGVFFRPLRTLQDTSLLRRVPPK